MKLLFIQGSDFFEQVYTFLIPRKDYVEGHFNDWFINIISSFKKEEIYSRTIFFSILAKERKEYPMEGYNADVVFLPISPMSKFFTYRYYYKKTRGIEDPYKYSFSFYPRIILSYWVTFSLELVKEIKRFKPDIIIVQDYESKVYDNVIILSKIFRIKIPVITVGTGEFPEQNWLERAIKKFTLKSARKIMCPNTKELIKVRNKYKGINAEIFFRGSFDERFFPEDKYKVIEKLGLDKEKKYILFVGQVSNSPKHAKGLSNLLNSFEFLKDFLPELVLLIIGRGMGLKGIAHVKNIGYVKDRDLLRNYYNASEFVVVPSRREGFPKVVVEAMACGKPVIGSDVGGISDQIIDNVTGFLIPPDNPEKLAEKISILLKNHELCEKMGEEGCKRARENFSHTAIGEKFIKMFNTLLSN